jgi:hypothetical protein
MRTEKHLSLAVGALGNLLPAVTILAVTILAVASSLTGCVIVPYRPAAETHQELSAIANPDRIRLTVGPHQFLAKMAHAVLRENPRLQQVDGQALIDSASPTQELTLARLLDPSTRALIAPLDLDYLVLLGQPVDRTLKKTGDVILYLGFFGATRQESSSTYWAAVIDARQLQVLGQLTSESRGTDSGVGLFYGLFIVSDTSGSARDNAARQVAATLAGARPSGPARVAFVAVEPIATAEEIAAQARRRERARERMRTPWSLEGYPAFVPASPPAGQALIYLYRPDKTLGSFHRMDVRAGPIDAPTQVAAVWSGGYFPWHLPPGAVRLAARPWLATDPQSTVTLNVEAGNTYYVKGTVTTGWKSPHVGLELVDPEKGRSQVRKCRLLPDARGTDAETLRRAEAGNAWSQIELAELHASGARYADGSALLPDGVEAYKWLTIAATDKAARGVALSSRATIAARLSAEQITEAEQRARLWLAAPENQPP